MLIQKTAIFSPDSKYFTCLTDVDRLLVWEISSNVSLIDYKLDSNVCGVCTSLYWISKAQNSPSAKKARLTRSQTINDQLLAVGTSKGDILLYNVTAQNLYSHLVSRHSDSVNDMCFYKETDSFFTCSNDKSIAIWDIISGQQKSKWTADDTPVSSICVLDRNNLLSASKSILWWDISAKTIIKKFCGHTSEIFKLLPVNTAMSLNCYFLSTAISDTKINAWSLSANDCQIPVASFISSEQPKDMDISRISSKDKPLILSVVTKEGNLNIFEHTLNGNVNQQLYPKATLKITPEVNGCELKKASIISVKLSDDLESCTVVAYGSSKDSVIFQCIKIKELLKEHRTESPGTKKFCLEDTVLPTKESSKIDKNVLNGLKSPEKSPKSTRLKDTTLVIKNPKQKKASSSHNTTAISLHESETPIRKRMQNDLKRRYIRDTDITDPDSSVGMLLRGLQTHSKDLIDAILYNGDTELICECVESLPSHTLRYTLEELSSRLKQHSMSAPTLCRWLKEILRVHLSFLIESQDTVEILGSIKEFVEAKRISETSSKLSVLKGLLSLQIQNTSSDESNSDSEESMES